jgi:hypothetical protein
LTGRNESYQWNISNKDVGACGEWNDTSLNSTFVNVSTSTLVVCNKLYFGANKRGMFIDFLMSVPADANTTIASGNLQTDTITITADTAI